MFFHIIVATKSGSAYTKKVKTVQPTVFSDYSLFPGQPAFLVTYGDNSIHTEFTYSIVENPEIVAHLAGDFYRLQLTESMLSRFPSLVDDTKKR